MRRALAVAWLLLEAGCGSTALAPDAGPPADVAAPADRNAPPNDLGAVATDSSGTGAGPALGKLCHELNRGGALVTLTLEIGEAPPARLSAITGKCTPPRGTPCMPIASGQVPVRLFEGDRVLAARTVVLIGGSEYVFQPIIDATGSVAITGGRIASGTCQDLDFPAPDGGAD